MDDTTKPAPYTPEQEQRLREELARGWPFDCEVARTAMGKLLATLDAERAQRAAADAPKTEAAILALKSCHSFDCPKKLPFDAWRARVNARARTAAERSVPSAEPVFPPDSAHHCNCGAAEHNAAVDRALATFRALWQRETAYRLDKDRPPPLLWREPGVLAMRRWEGISGTAILMRATYLSGDDEWYGAAGVTGCEFFSKFHCATAEEAWKAAWGAIVDFVGPVLASVAAAPAPVDVIGADLDAAQRLARDLLTRGEVNEQAAREKADQLARAVLALSGASAPSPALVEAVRVSNARALWAVLRLHENAPEHRRDCGIGYWHGGNGARAWRHDEGCARCPIERELVAALGFDPDSVVGLVGTPTTSPALVEYTAPQPGECDCADRARVTTIEGVPYHVEPGCWRRIRGTQAPALFRGPT